MSKLQKSLAELRGELGVLANALRDAADAIDAEGRLPGAGLVGQIGGVELAFAEMLEQVSARDGELFTLGELENAIQRYQVGSRVKEVIRRCRQIDSEVVDANFADLLGKIFAHADDVEAALQADVLAQVEVAGLEAVVALVEGRGKSSIAELFELQQIVGNHFGGMTAFALATRGVFRVEDAGHVEVDGEQSSGLGEGVLDPVAEGVIEDSDRMRELTDVEAPVSKKAVKPVKVSKVSGPKRRRLSMDDVRLKKEKKEGEEEVISGKFFTDAPEDQGKKLPEVKLGDRSWSADLKTVQMPSFFVKPVIKTEVEPLKDEFSVVKDSESPAVESPKVMRQRVAVVDVGDASEMEDVSEAALEAAEEAEPGYLVWKLLDSGEDALAYHLARGLEDDAKKLVSWRVIRAAILGTRVTHSYGQTIGLIHEDAGHYDSSRYFSKWNFALNDGLRLLLAGGMLIPTVIGGESSASNVLRDLKFNDSLGCVYEFCQALIHLRARLPQRIDGENIHVTRDSALWKAECEELAGEIREFQVQAPQRTARYHRATEMWKRWLEDGQLIGNLMTQMLDSGDVDVLKIESVEEMIGELADRGTLEKLIQASDRHFHTTKIEGKTIDQLLKFSEEPVSLGLRWVRLHRRNPFREQNDYVQQHILELRTLLDDRLGEVRKAVSRLGNRGSSAATLYSRVGARFFGQALDRLAELFDPNGVVKDESDPDPRMLLNTPLLRIASLRLDEDYEPVAGFQEIADLISGGMEEGFAGYREAFHAQLKRADHLASGQLLSVLRAQTLVSASDLDGLERERDKAIRFQRIAIVDALKETRRRLERSVAYGLVIERDRSRYSASLEAIEQRLEQQEERGEGDVRLFEYLEMLEAIDRELEASLKGQVETVYRRLHGLNVLVDDAVRSRVEKIVEQGDPVTANDYIDMLERGEQLPDEAESNSFDAFFEVGQFRALEKGLQTMGARLSMALRDGHPCPGIEVEGISEGQLKSASALLSAWFSGKSQEGKNVSGSIDKVLTGLGFHVESVADPTVKPNRVGEYSVRVQPLRDRNLCPLASYGSNVGGHYKVICVWSGPDVGELLSIVGENSYMSGVIVFYFGRMSRQQRSELAARSQKERRTFLVLDDTLTYWLCGERSTRLLAFFECAFPFTYAVPFDATASQVPPEMFYGRRLERERIEDPHGTCFIYGGRQLGKTALLRHVVRERHAPAEGRVFLWVDLKASGLGHSQSIDRIGHVIANALKAESVVPKGMVSNMLEETIYEHIASWLGKDEQRRILLLLDEADRFLELDAHQDFLHCSRLKNLMERTNRRFKVVFAGLHNVQRTTRRENHPLAHFGEPICIGPLYENGEWREALELIERPFETIGFRFETRDLPFRILSQTNFYPSLLQIYGKELLRYLYQYHEQALDPNQSPPYVVKTEHLQKAYQSQSLRDNIRQKFQYTLQLDQRYEVIVYAIAHEVRHHNPDLLIDGFSVSRVRELALHWWEEGFMGIDSGHEIRVLLDEMVGLGVLRQVEAGRYTLRNFNIVLLLGTNQEIDEELLRERTLQAEYEPASFRSTLGDDAGGSFKRSPLTRAQESQILESTQGVLAVFGTDAAGYGYLAKRLEQLGGGKLVSIRVKEDVRAFEKALDDAFKSRKGDGLWIFHVATDVGWDREWLEVAVAISKRQQSHRSVVRVVFSADAAKVWELCGQIGDEEELLSEVGLEQVVTMESWRDPAVQMWLRDVQESVMLNRAPELSELTGNWSHFLYTLLNVVYDEGVDDWDGVVERYKDATVDSHSVGGQLARFGVPLDIRALLGVIVEKDGNFDVDILLQSGFGIDEIQRFVRWGRWLRLVRLNSRTGGFELDPVLKELLEFRVLHDV